MDRDPKNGERKEEVPRFDGEIGRALTGYAKDGGAWLLGKNEFEAAISEGERVDDALYRALALVREDGETECSPEEAAQRFWQDSADAKAAIEAALTGYARDGGSWQLGEWHFYEALENGLSIEQALKIALGKAGEDGAETSEEKASDKFWRTLQPDREKAKKIEELELGDGIILNELIHKPKWGNEKAGTYTGEKDGKPVIVKHGDKEALSREREILSRAQYRGIPKVVSYMEDVEPLEGLTRLGMERLPGKSLDGMIGLDKDWKSKPLDPEAAITITVGLTRCFEELSKRGYLYRDMNLGHVIVDDQGDGEFDVGLVDVESSAKKDKHGGNASLVGVRGTWETMSPEEFDGGPINEASNVYSLGCVLNQLVSGESPFRVPGKNVEGRYEKERQLHKTGADVRISGELGDVLRKALDPDPAQRYASLLEFKKALKKVR